MGLRGIVGGRLRSQYKKLICEDEKATRPRRRWVKKMNGRLMGLRLSTTRRLNWKGFSMLLMPRKVVGIYAEMVKRMKLEDIYPAIIFSSQWGLPVLSHSSSPYLY